MGRIEDCYFVSYVLHLVLVLGGKDKNPTSLLILFLTCPTVKSPWMYTLNISVPVGNLINF